MIKRLRVTVDGNPYEVTVELASDDSAPAPAAPLAAPAPAPPQAAPPPAAAPAPGPAREPSGPAAPGDVPSPLSGCVAAVIVKEGQAVTEGDHLITLEAMKMNTFVFAPRGGTVTAIKTAVGALVEEGQTLVTIG